MPRRTSTRLRSGASSAMSDGESSGGGGGSGGGGSSSGSGGGCPPLPPSPGKRKARSPAEEIEMMAGGLTNPNPVRCMSFQSPKKKALGDGIIGDRFSAPPFDKENNHLFVGSSGGGGDAHGSIGASSLFGGPSPTDARAGSSFRPSAFSAFSHHAPKGGAAAVTSATTTRAGARRRSRQQLAVSAGTVVGGGGAAAAGSLPSSSSPSPRVADTANGPMLPFLLAPARVKTRSPDTRTKMRPSSSRRSTRRINSSRNRIGTGVGVRNSRDSSSSSSNSNSGSSPSPGANLVLATVSLRPDGGDTANPPRGSPRSTAAGCAAGGRRAAVTTAAASAESAASPTTGKNSGGGGPAGSCRRVLGGARVGMGGGRGGDTMSEPDQSPHRSPIHRLTESLQKWDPGSRYGSPADTDAIKEGGDIGVDPSIIGGHPAACGAGGGAGTGAGAGKDVGSSWNGQELRRTLENERAGRGRRRRHSITSAQDIQPQGRFGDHSPISPASSVASIHLGGFDTGTPASAGRPWRSSPRRPSSGRSTSGGNQDNGDGGGSEERFAVVRMEGSWSDDELGPSSTAMRLAFSPSRICDARTPTGQAASPTPAVASATATVRARYTGGAGAAAPTPLAGAAASGSTAAATPSTVRWQQPFSPVKGGRSGSGYTPGGGRSTFSLASPALSRNGNSSSGSNSPAAGSVSDASPDGHSLHLVRDMMDQGTDDEEDGSGGTNGGGALMRRRRRRPRSELALRTLEMPDATEMVTAEREGSRAERQPSSLSEAGPASSRDIAGGNVNGTLKSGGCSIPNPLLSPEFRGRGLAAGSGTVFGSGCPTGRPRWENLSSSNPADVTVALEESAVYHHGTPAGAADDLFTRGGGGKGKSVSDWGQSSSGVGAGAAQQDLGEETVGCGVNAVDSSAVTLGLSAVSGADMSGVSDASTSFVKSRPIPDQSAFSSSSRLSKGGVGAPHSPIGSGGSGGGGGPAAAPGPTCLTPRKSIMRCPPTPQRTPTWDGLEDSLLLEGAGSGGGGGGGPSSAGLSNRHSLRRSKLLASSDPVWSSGGKGFDGVSSMSIDAGLANASSSSSSSSSSSPSGEGSQTASMLLEAAAMNGNPSIDGDICHGSGGSDEGGVRGRNGRVSTRSGLRSQGRGQEQRANVAVTSNESGSGSALNLPNTGKAAVDGSSSAAAGTAPGGAGGNSKTDSTLGFKHDFVQMGPIGEGGFSVVWKVRARGTGKLYAIKRSKREFRGRRDRDRCLLEAKALQRLGEHPGVLRFERAWQEEGHFCLQTELCELGTLKDFLEKLPSRTEIPEPAVWQVLQDVGQALQHVHATGLVHLDVKPANLLIGDEGGRLKLADFGMATAYGEGMVGVGDGQEGDTLYMAKELLSSTERLPSADMFSLGLTVYEVATRIELPGDGEDWHAMRDGRYIGLPPSRSQELAAVLRQLMHPDPKQRPTAESLCKNPRVVDVDLGSNADVGSGSAIKRTSNRRRRASGRGGSSSVSSTAAANGTPASSENASSLANGTRGTVETTGHDRDDCVFNQAKIWRAAEAAAMDHPSSGLRTPTGDMSARYIFQQNG